MMSFISTRHMLESLLNPLSLIPLVFAISVGCLFLRWHKRLAITGVVVSLVAFIICSTAWLPKKITRYLEYQYPVVIVVDPSIHWVVVLGGGQMRWANLAANHLLYSPSIKRLIEGVRLFRLLPAAKLLLSGGGEGRPEAVDLAVLASWQSIPADKVELEINSSNTAEQAVAIKKLLNNQPFYLVTSAIHMPRAMALCQQQGLHPLAAPTDYTVYWDDAPWKRLYIPNAGNVRRMNIAWHEILGQIWSKMVGSVAMSTILAKTG